MYSTKFPYYSVFNSAFRTNNLNTKSACSDKFVIKCIWTYSTDKMTNIISNIFGRNRQILDILVKHLQLTSKMKNNSTIIIRAWTRQCEYIAAQRFRRTQQMFCLYTRLWEERALREVLKRMRQQVSKRCKELVLSAVGISAFNWETDKISDDELHRQLNEFDYVNQLTSQTVLCKKCKCRRLVDIMLPDKTYCKCDGAKVNNEYILDNWEPYLERKDLLVWRRPRNNNYEYKLHGTFDDVTALDYLHVQIDTEFRKVWDNTAVQLDIIDTDTESNSDIIYWEMQWPRMFSNRDYVFNRRYMIDEENKICVIMNKSAMHPSCPNKPNKQRVTEYESCMVIRPIKDLDKPGIEFCLTYYDDPGVNIPAAVCSWVAIAGMPDFLNKLRIAAKEYHEMNKNSGSPVKNFPSDEDILIIDLSGVPTTDEDTPKKISTEDENEETSNDEPDITSKQETDTKTYWHYTHPYYYLG